MPQTYTLSLVNRHLFAFTVEGRILVDTGAPKSASPSGQLTWGSSVRRINKGGYQNFTFEKLSEDIGVQVDGLLGMDLLHRDTVLFDLPRSELTLGAPMPAGAQSKTYSTVIGSDIPVFATRLNGRSADVIWDTGAQFGYLTDRKFAEGVTPTDGFEDFSPLFGDIPAPESHIIPMVINGRNFTERFGLAPDSVNPSGLSPVSMRHFLRTLKIDAIIGPSWLQGVKAWIDPSKQAFALID